MNFLWLSVCQTVCSTGTPDYLCSLLKSEQLFICSTPIDLELQMLIFLSFFFLPNAVRSTMSTLIFQQIKVEGFIVTRWPKKQWNEAHKEIGIWIKEVLKMGLVYRIGHRFRMEVYNLSYLHFVLFLQQITPLQRRSVVQSQRIGFIQNKIKKRAREKKRIWLK